MTDTATTQITLPERIVSSIDLSRTLRELEALDESLRQAELRKPGESTKLARSSVSVEELARLNNVQLTDTTQRGQLIELMKAFQKHAPRIHMSLAAEPSANFVRKTLIWMRANIHPLVLVEVGLQPTLAAGCVIRTNNRMFDMSLRHRFADNRHMLVEKISEIGAAKEQAVAVTVAPVAQTAPVAPAVSAPVPATASAAQAPAVQTNVPTAALQSPASTGTTEAIQTIGKTA